VVFVYLNSSGLPTATFTRPAAQVGEFAFLQVTEVTRFGAFLDWGLPKELLVPFSEQPERLRPGRRYVVRLYLDDRGRVVGSARIDKWLESETINLRAGDRVALLLWEFTDLGAKVIIDNRYGGLLYRDEIHKGMHRGDRFPGYVRRVREDGKIDITLRKGGREAVDEAREQVLAALSRDGFLSLHDRSAPQEIEAALGMSKKTFKKAVGGLYKEGRVELTPEGIRLKKKSK
jgi:predicted RNA-binding protein (virulence factor B family)